jgi:hypothetical protein
MDKRFERTDNCLIVMLKDLEKLSRFGKLDDLISKDHIKFAIELAKKSKLESYCLVKFADDKCTILGACIFFINNMVEKKRYVIFIYALVTRSGQPIVVHEKMIMILKGMSKFIIKEHKTTAIICRDVMKSGVLTLKLYKGCGFVENCVLTNDECYMMVWNYSEEEDVVAIDLDNILYIPAVKKRENVTVVRRRQESNIVRDEQNCRVKKIDDKVKLVPVVKIDRDLAVNVLKEQVVVIGRRHGG